MITVAEIFPPTKPVNVKVSVPGSKSITNRAVLIAALAKGITTISGASKADDSVIMIDLLQKLGIKVSSKRKAIIIEGAGGKFKSFKGELNVGDAGTVMRFLSALCCLVPGEVVLKGTGRMHERPIHNLVDGLTQLGAKITYLQKKGFPPIKIGDRQIKGGNVKIDASESSQFVSALLMVAPILNGDTDILCGDEIASQPYIAMTIAVMEEFGIKIEPAGRGHYLIKGNRLYKPTDYAVEGDASSASYLFAAAALTAGTVEVLNVSPYSMQGDIEFADLLGKMGCKVRKGKTIKVTGCTRLKPIVTDMSAMPDTAQTLAVVAAFAEGESHLHGLKTLQYKETRRITALKTELKKIGITCKADNNSLHIKGGKQLMPLSGGALINTYNDHRMAMAFAIAGAKIPGISIENPEAVRKSFPNYWTTLQEIGFKVKLK